MLFIGFAINNPFSKRKFNVLYEKSYNVRKHKHIDILFSKRNVIIGFTINLQPRQDHACYGFDVELFGYNFDFNFYDDRHWDDEKGCFINYEETN